MTKCITLLMAGLLTLVSSLICVNESHAAFGTVSMKFDNVSPTVTGTVKSTAAPIISTNTNIGRFNWSGVEWNLNTPIDGLDTSLKTLTTFCIELAQNISNGGTYTYQVVDLTSAPAPSSSSPIGGINSDRASYLKLLYDSQYDTLLANPTNATVHAAFQLAVWELTHETKDTSTTSSHFGVLQGDGTFYLDALSSAAGTLANSWLAAILGGTAVPTNNYQLYALTSSSNQDQIFAVEVDLPGTGAVPEATAMVTWAMILFSASFASRPTRREREMA